MLDQLKSSRDATEITNRLAEASQTSADIAQSSQRAWVGPTGAKTVGSLAVDTELQVTIPYLNTGREPALDVFDATDAFTVTLEDNELGVASGKAAEYLTKCLNTQPNLNGGIVYPTTGFSSYNLNTTIKKELIDWDVIYGTKLIVLTGCYVYSTHGGIHRSTVCFAFQNGNTKPEAWSFCPQGNYAD